MRKRQQGILLSLLREHKRNPSGRSLSILIEEVLSVEKEQARLTHASFDPEAQHKVPQGKR